MTDIDIEDENSKAQKTKLVVGLLVLVISTLLVYNVFFRGDHDPKPKGKPAISQTNDSDLNIGEATRNKSVDEEAWRIQIENENLTLKNTVSQLKAELENEQDKNSDRFDAFRKEMLASQKKQSQQLADLRKQKHVDEYNDISNSTLGNPWEVDPNAYGGSSIDSTTRLGENKSQPARYVTLGSRRTGQSAVPDKRDNTSSSEFSIDLPGLERINTTDSKSSEPNEDKNAQSKQTGRSKNNKSEAVDENFNTLQIAAGSFVDVTPLMTVHCPIGPSAMGSAKSQLPPAKVFLAVNAEFREPNGKATYAGTVHLIGTCSAHYHDSEYGFAVVNIHTFSLKDDVLGAQSVEVQGILGRKKPAEQNIKAKIDKIPRQAVMALALAQGANSYAEFVTKSQMSRSFTAGGPVEILDGDLAKAAGGQVGAGVTNAYKERLDNIVASMFDSVPIKAGLELVFVTESIIEFKVPKSEFNELDADTTRLL